MSKRGRLLRKLLGAADFVGESITTDVVTGRKIATGILRCCHCSMRWEYTPGSRRLRGYCSICRWVTCGKRCCDERRQERHHVTEEARVEALEGTRNPTRLVVPVGVKVQ